MGSSWVRGFAVGFAVVATEGTDEEFFVDDDFEYEFGEVAALSGFSVVTGLVLL